MKLLLSIFIASMMMLNLAAQSLQEKMGFAPEDKLLILHADDAGVSYSTNKAVIESFEQGQISSTAIMVPCPWFPQIAAYAQAHPEYDFGLHLTLSSEWHGYKWGGVAPSSKIVSLLDEQGYFYATNEEVRKHACVEDVETELRAQIEKALAAGIKPSHFDTHMNTIYSSPEIYQIYFKLGEEYKVPVMVMANADYPDSMNIDEISGYPAINIYSGEVYTDPLKWEEYYISLVEELQSGISEIIVHLAYDDDETRAMTKGHDYYEASWRQRDVKLVKSPAFQEAIKEHNIHLISWGDIQRAMYPKENQE